MCFLCNNTDWDIDKLVSVILTFLHSDKTSLLLQDVYLFCTLRQHLAKYF